MKYAQIREGRVVELIPEIDANFPEISITERFSAEFLAACEAVDDTVLVGYKKTDAGFEPEIPPEPRPVTIEDYRAKAKARLDGCCSGAIYAGTTVTCSAERGAKHYAFTDEAQRAITLMAQGVSLGQLSFSYKADDEEYNAYTADEVKVLFKALGDWITANTKYKEILEKWIEQETDTTVLGAIHYGSAPPETLLTELVTYLTQLNIDTTGLVSLFN